MSRHPSAVTSGGDGIGGYDTAEFMEAESDGGKLLTRAAMDSLLRSAVRCAMPWSGFAPLQDLPC
jgi:hypothetical protein